MRDRAGGFIGIFVTVGLFGIGLAAGIFSVAVNNAEDLHTMRALTEDPPTTPVTDQQIANARHAFDRNAQILTGFTSLGTAPLIEGRSSAEVAGSALVQLANDPIRPAVADYLSDPSSRWNRNGGADRPTRGTTPTGGTIPTDSDDPDSFAATVTIAGTGVAFRTVSLLSTVSSGVNVGAWDTGEPTPSETATTMVVITDPTRMSGPGTYDLGASEAMAMVGFHARQFLNNDGSPVGFESTAGTLTVTAYATRVGGRFAGSFDAVLSGEQWIDGKGTTKTLVGSTSGTFDVKLGP